MSERRGFVHHIDLTVRDLNVSAAFYDAILGFMGYMRSHEDSRGIDWDLTDTRGGFCSVGIKSAEGAARAHDRYSPGLHHLAWSAESRDDVDRLYALLLEVGATVLDAPAAYPQYGPTYYAVFFADPDGLKLEFVYQAHTS
jgi:glyoxylase I family protein